jgi:hypothetical protein
MLPRIKKAPKVAIPVSILGSLSSAYYIKKSYEERVGI